MIAEYEPIPPLKFFTFPFSYKATAFSKVGESAANFILLKSNFGSICAIAPIKALQTSHSLGGTLFRKKFEFLAKPEWGLALNFRLCPNVLAFYELARTE